MAGYIEHGLELAGLPRIAGVPRFVFGEAVRAMLRTIAAHLRGDAPPTRLLPMLRLAYLAGYASEARRQLVQKYIVAVGNLKPSAES